jgi:hypothetical protein
MKALTPASVVRQMPSISFKEMEGEGILLSLVDGFYYGLNETAVFIWRQLDGKRDLAAVVDNLSRHFHIKPANAQKDVLQWADKLLEAKLAQTVRKS